jgi:hypothetical protein
MSAAGDKKGKKTEKKEEKLWQEGHGRTEVGCRSSKTNFLFFYKKKPVARRPYED